jgi:hypothetical protein
MRRVKYLRLSNGREPFLDWFYSLEISYRARIRPYIYRLAEEKRILNPLVMGFLK